MNDKPTIPPAGTHGGKRTPGPGKKLGPQKKPPSDKSIQAHYVFHPSTIAALNKLPASTRARFVEATVRMALDLPQLPGPDYLTPKE